MIKGFRQIAGLTTFSRILGMVRDMLFATFLGRSGLMDIWVIAFKIPNLSRRIFGEGALTSSLLPVYMKTRESDVDQAERLGNTVITVLCLVLLGVVLLAMVVLTFCRWLWVDLTSTELMLSLTTVMLPYMVLICLVAAMAGLLQAHRHFAMPALAPVVLNVVLITALAVSGWSLGWLPERQLGFVAVAVLIAGVLQLALQLPALRRCGFELRPYVDLHSPAFRQVMCLMGPMVLGLTVTQINTLSDDVIAKIFSGSEDKGVTFALAGRMFVYPLWDGAVSSLFYSQRLYQFPLGVLGISLGTAIFPVMSQAAGQGDMTKLVQTLNQGLKAALFVALPATAGMLVVRLPLVAAIFEGGRFTEADSLVVARILCFYVIGLSGYFLQQIVTRAYFSLQDSRGPFHTALVAVVVNLVLNLALIWWLQAAGLALATALCSYLQVALLLVGLGRRLDRSSLWHEMGPVLVKTLIATGGMTGVALVMMWAMQSLPETRGFQVLRLLAVVPVAAGAYLAMARAMQMEQVQLILGRGRGRAR